MRAPTLLAVAGAAGPALSSIVWDGRFNDLATAADLDAWSWANQTGPYQWYIHGPGPTESYVALSADYGNPGDAGSAKGARLTLDATSHWEGQETMRRTELVPQASGEAARLAMSSGKVWYHVSVMRGEDGAPAAGREHQVAFFESHFTELRVGSSSQENGEGAPLQLQWMAGGSEQWRAEMAAGVWHNFAYEIDFDGATVGLWHSTGAEALALAVEPVSVTGASSNGADWHVGVLELAREGFADGDEDLYFSGVYIEDGSLTQSISGPGA